MFNVNAQNAMYGYGYNQTQMKTGMYTSLKLPRAFMRKSLSHHHVPY